jgi:hypothetical protein
MAEQAVIRNSEVEAEDVDVGKSRADDACDNG